MNEEDRLAQRRYFVMMIARLSGAAGAVFGIVLVARAVEWPDKAIGIALIIASLVEMAIVPLALARRWRSGG
ncbi:hypothetical protein [Sphingomonas sp.]|uniref:hypothetical protein n=1 Tax=Sphingomonas sp. TaxID=28214 RepID=UPI001DB8F85B|nr:hypothetical protein [Sphingomonas sp.]MBX9796994.1 hypothetical protein [Sphingomonas sp.]